MCVYTIENSQDLRHGVEARRFMGSTFDSRLSKASGARAQVHLVAKEASNRVGVASGVCCHTHSLVDAVQP